MGGYDPNPPKDSDTPAQTAWEAEARAGAAVQFRGSYNDPYNPGRVERNWELVQENDRYIQQQENERRQRLNTGQQQPQGGGAAFDMAREAARRGEVVDPTVMRKARQQGYTGEFNASPSISPGAASRLASTRPIASRGNLFADATAFTPLTATFIGKSAKPKFSPESGSATERFAFDEYGKVLRGGKFEPAYNKTGVPVNTKMGNGDYTYIGEFKYDTGQTVSRYYERNVRSYVDFSEAGAAGPKEIGIRSGGSPGAMSATQPALPSPFKSTLYPAPFKSSITPDANGGISPLDFRANAATQSDATGGINIQKKPFLSTFSPVQGNAYTDRNLPAPFISGTKTSTRIMPKGELPFIGEVPLISQLIARGGSALQDSGLTDKQYQDTTIMPSRGIVTRNNEITVAGRMASGKSDFSYRLSTTFSGLDSKPWVPSRGEIAIGPPKIGETRAVGSPLVTTAIDPLTGDIITTSEQAYEQESFQKYQPYDISKQTYSFRPAIVSNETRTEKGTITTFEDSIRLKIPSPERGEQAVRVASLTNPFMAPSVISSVLTEKFNPGAAEGAQTMESLTGLRGQYTGFYQHPVAGVINYGIGAGMGGISRGAGAIGSKISSLSSKGDKVVKGINWLVPKALTGMYVADVGYRSTEGLTNFEPMRVVGKAIVTSKSELVPMTMGFSAGYRSPELLRGGYNFARTGADFTYRSAVRAPGEFSNAMWSTRQRMAGIERIPRGSSKYDFTVSSEVPTRGAPDNVRYLRLNAPKAKYTGVFEGEVQFTQKPQGWETMSSGQQLTWMKNNYRSWWDVGGEQRVYTRDWSQPASRQPRYSNDDATLSFGGSKRYRPERVETQTQRVMEPQQEPQQKNSWGFTKPTFKEMEDFAAARKIVAKAQPDTYLVPQKGQETVNPAFFTRSYRTGMNEAFFQPGDVQLTAYQRSQMDLGEHVSNRNLEFDTLERINKSPLVGFANANRESYGTGRKASNSVSSFVSTRSATKTMQKTQTSLRIETTTVNVGGLPWISNERKATLIDSLRTNSMAITTTKPSSKIIPDSQLVYRTQKITNPIIQQRTQFIETRTPIIPVGFGLPATGSGSPGYGGRKRKKPFLELFNTRRGSMQQAFKMKRMRLW